MKHLLSNGQPKRSYGVVLIVLLCFVSQLVAAEGTIVGQGGTITGSLVSDLTPIHGPVTVHTTFQFDGEVRNTEDGVWAAGFARQPNEAPTALALTFSQVSAGWLGPLWGVQLQSDAGIIPSTLSPQDGSGFLSGSEFILLRSAPPTWGHEYEAKLGYDPRTGHASIQIMDITDGEMILARNLQLNPYPDPLYASAGVGRPVDDGFDLNVVAGVASIVRLNVTDHVVPVNVSWWVMQRPTEDQSYLTVRQIDRRNDTVMSVNLPWESPSGVLSLAFINEDGANVLEAPFDMAAEFTSISATALPPGNYYGALRYTVDDHVWTLDRRDLTVGLIEVDVEYLDAVIADGATVILDGALAVASDGPIGDVTVGLNASLVHHQFEYTALQGVGDMKSEPMGGTAVIEPTPVTLDDEIELKFTVSLPLPDVSERHSIWELQIEPFSGPSRYFTEGALYQTWVDAGVQDEAWRGFVQNESIQRKQLAPGVEVATIRGRIAAGPISMYLVAVDMTHPGVTVDALVGNVLTTPASSRWPRSQPSQMVESTGAVAGVNSAFFDISDSMNPLGIVMRSGELLKTERAGFEPAIGVSKDGLPYLGYWQWIGGVQKPDGSHYRGIAGLNITSPGASLALFRPPATRTIGSTNAETPVVELVLRELPEEPVAVSRWDIASTRAFRGVVEEVRMGKPSLLLREGMMVLSGGGENGDYLVETFSVGDVVEIPYRLTNRTEWPYLDDWLELNAAVSGGVVLLRNGQYGDVSVTTNRDRHPRTAVGISLDQSRLYLLVVDGRSATSVGMTYREMADFFRYIGAFHALNLDGGGSTGLAVFDPDLGRVEVLNVPSDGRQRYVPDGIGVFYHGE